MKKTVAVKFDDVFTQGEDVYDGLVRYGGDLEVAHFDAAKLRNSIITAEAAVRGYDEAVAAKVLAVAAQTEADEQGQQFIRIARNMLAVRLGERYSALWAPTGFPDKSTATPKTIGARQALLRALQNYFANHGSDEVPALNITGVQAGVQFNNLSDKRSSVNNAYDLMNAAKVARDTAVENLRRMISDCIDELGQLMEDDDPRWYSFGLTPPAVLESPEVVDDVVLSHAGPGRVLAAWTGAPRAGRYRVLKQVVGVDAEPVPVETVYDTQFAFTGLTAGQTLRVFVEAANEAGVAEPSEAVEIVVS